jgi:SAM-dependent methyltransferase
MENLLPAAGAEELRQWLTTELNRKILRRLPREYSTLIKIPFSVELGHVAEARAERTAWTIKHRLPAAIPYAIFHLEINRLLTTVGLSPPPPSESEFEVLLTHYGRNAVAKARIRYPEVWDELRGHYVLDSRGWQFAKRLVSELKSRNLLSASSRFVDVGSGVGTNVFAVNHYSEAHATGIERHPGLLRMSNVIQRRIGRLGLVDSQRLDWVLGDAFDADVTDLGQFDVYYVYSPLGMWEIDIDTVVDHAKVGAVIIFNQFPIRNRELVQPLKKVAGLYTFRKIAQGPPLLDRDRKPEC